MGAFYTVLVDSSVGLDEAPGEAARMVNWLQERGIIASTEVEKGSAESPDCSDNQVENTVYRPGPNFLEASDDADDPRFSILRLEDNSLEVVSKRTIFHAGDNGIGIPLPEVRYGAERAG
jgi:hypothetical protein